MNYFLKISYKLIAIGFALLFFGACSQKKNTLVNRSFHNLTAHYNGYYWARENVKEGVDKLSEATVDDYTKLLPLYRYADDKAAKANFPSFDKAIEKTSLVIQRHSMLIRGKEYCSWIDENYLVVGQSHFYKRDYFAALEIFEYIVRQYPKSDTRYSAMLWMIKTYNAMNSVMNTQAIIDLLANDKKLPKKFTGTFSTLKAEYYMLNENYDKAIFELKKAIPYTRPKKQRARFVFILGQLYERKGELKKASDYYNTCTRLHPPYEMYFNAKMKRAETAQNSDDLKNIKKELAKMLKDDKNIEYRDQIYYSLGDIALREKDTLKGSTYLKNSVQASLTNTKQKGISALRLADIYFEQTDYKLAQAYYDSASVLLPKDFKNYALIETKKNSLTELVKNLNTIHYQDSMLRVASMSEKNRDALIEKLIARIIADEKRKEEEKTAELNNPLLNTLGNNSTNTNFGGTAGQTGGAWYFYNPSTLSFGFAEFVKKWGNRPLEDNWRRSIKESVIDNTNPASTTTTQKDSSGGKLTPVASNKKKEYYLKDVPFTDELKEKAHAQIIDAYYTTGSIYKEYLQNYPRSIEAFETLNKRYPQNKYLLQDYYLLYRLNLNVKNQKRADYYKELITKNYPESEYAKIINNPSFNKDISAKRNEIERFYDNTFDLFTHKEYNRVIANANTADSLYSKSELAPKFDLLRAYALAKSGTEKEYINALARIIIKHPKDAVAQKAQELIDYLNTIKAPKDTTKKTGAADSLRQALTYVVNKNSPHYFLVSVNNEQTPVNVISDKVKTFTKNKFSALPLENTTESLNDVYKLVVVKSFESAEKAYAYYEAIAADPDLFKDINPGAYTLTVISADNFTRLLKRLQMDEYLQFFSQHYKK